jgi:DNA-binding LytR/AlgR family response regulator
VRVEIRIDAGLPEPVAVLHLPELTSEIAALVGLLENAGVSAPLVTAKRDDKSYVIEPGQTELVRTESGIVVLYDREARSYTLDRPLHEMGKRLGQDFVRISKSALVNIHRIDHVSQSFNGTMDIIMKNGMNDYISRKYLGDFKKRLGL